MTSALFIATSTVKLTWLLCLHIFSLAGSSVAKDSSNSSGVLSAGGLMTITCFSEEHSLSFKMALVCN